MECNDLYRSLIQLEENARILYLEFSRICDERIKDTMISFSEEENKHKKVLHNQFLYLDNNIDLNNEVVKLIQKLKDYYDNMEYASAFHKDKEFFIFALSVEKDAINVYSKILENIGEDSNAYSIFHWLVEEEKKHMLYIVKRLHELQ